MGAASEETGQVTGTQDKDYNLWKTWRMTCRDQQLHAGNSR
jgi:hypothetical protein